MAINLCLFEDRLDLHSMYHTLGNYRYEVAPQEFLASGDPYNQHCRYISQYKVKVLMMQCMLTYSIAAAFFKHVNGLTFV